MRDPIQLRKQIEESGGHVLREGEDGMAATVPLQGGGVILCLIVSWGDGWDHVSAHAEADEMKPSRPPVGEHQVSTGRLLRRCPRWSEMCFVKDLCFFENECVVQYHPPSKDYVNQSPEVLHMWKPQNKPIPMPPISMV